jgi:hypothetical protein
MPGPSTGDLRDRLLRIFEQTRQAPGTPYEAGRLLAFLTEPPARTGRRVADTFPGRRRFVRFMHAVQLETGVCFTLEDWERGFGLDDLTNLVAAKMATPDQSLRLARRRLAEARGRQVADPVKFGLLTLPFLVVAGLADSWPVRIACALVWVGIVGAVAAFCIAELRYSQALVSRLATRMEAGA